jgi:hypothetical protein
MENAYSRKPEDGSSPKESRSNYTRTSQRSLEVETQKEDGLGMSDWEPLDDYNKRSNEMCNSIWKYIDKLSEHIKTLPEGQNKQYLEQYRSTLSMMAELAFFSAVSMTEMKNMKEVVYRVLFKEVFGNREIILPYEPKEEETIHGIAKDYNERKPFIDWQRRFLVEEANDLEDSSSDEVGKDLRNKDKRDSDSKDE